MWLKMAKTCFHLSLFNCSLKTPFEIKYSQDEQHIASSCAHALLENNDLSMTRHNPEAFVILHPWVMLDLWIVKASYNQNIIRSEQLGGFYVIFLYGIKLTWWGLPASHKYMGPSPIYKVWNTERWLSGKDIFHFHASVTPYSEQLSTEKVKRHGNGNHVLPGNAWDAAEMHPIGQ
ncbi:hypothetical protein EDD16DRAFT_1528345 [Pisolithus croceorrhizus]|nr:hypothetical protein EDD16DRAFT_1528345 [Pisolithus croceorrhizus]KAI6097442.1 hypothetical protein EV401DRAFT_1895503 [Pisolithus croceorrhizus]KAI6152694.1 hypothetical protein EDD17DRAFT_1513263 [Pisolithus thermaeus]